MLFEIYSFLPPPASVSSASVYRLTSGAYVLSVDYDLGVVFDKSSASKKRFYFDPNMSGFAENPFDDNPFADPSVQQVANTTSNTQRGLEDYDPFGGQTTAAQPNRPLATAPAAANPPLNVPSYQAPANTPPVVSPGQAPQVSTADFQRRQEELERKAQELARREEELRGTTFNARRNNWPPLPEKFCVQPCFYQDINVEIPPEFQKIVRLIYYVWAFHALLYVLNIAGSLALFINNGAGAMFGLALLYGILFTPASYVCWFRPVYKAFRSDSSFNFMVFFVIFFAQLIASVIQAIGLPNMGSCGIIVALSTLTQGGVSNIVVGVLVLLIGLGFAGAAFVDFLLIVKVQRLYRNTGASFAKAQQEFTSGVLRNEHVQGAATNIAAQALRTQMANATQSGPTAPRF